MKVRLVEDTSVFALYGSKKLADFKELCDKLEVPYVYCHTHEGKHCLIVERGLYEFNSKKATKFVVGLDSLKPENHITCFRLSDREWRLLFKREIS